MKLNSAFFSSLFALNIALVSGNVFAENKASPDRWFEIEVILFHQLNDKNALKEQFPDGINASNLPDYPQSFDLLEHYLQPNLTNIKQFVPLCDDADKQQLFLQPFQSINLPTPLLDIESTITTDTSEFINNTQDEASAQLTTQLTDENNLTIKAEPEKLIEVNKINKQAANQPFAFDLQKDDLANPLFSFNEICIISQQALHNIVEKQQLPSENIDSFAVSSLPNKLNAAGIHTGQEPYLIADDALLLKDINQRLGWSREFKPLFHFGWRQIGITEQKAIPLKLMAGKHVEHYYQQALEQLELDFKEAENIEQNLLEQLATNQNMIQANNKVDSEYFNQNTEEKLYLDVDEKSQRKIAQKQQALMQLLADLNVINNKPISSEIINEIVSSIENQTLDTIIHDNPSADTEKPLIDPQHLTKPIQPWFLEGFIKVHLDHYLYITADLRKELYGHFIYSDISTLNKTSSGGMITSIMIDIGRITGGNKEWNNHERLQTNPRTGQIQFKYNSVYA